jgi:hypothetical protein
LLKKINLLSRRRDRYTNNVISRNIGEYGRYLGSRGTQRAQGNWVGDQEIAQLTTYKA